MSNVVSYNYSVTVSVCIYSLYILLCFLFSELVLSPVRKEMLPKYSTMLRT